MIAMGPRVPLLCVRGMVLAPRSVGLYNTSHVPRMQEEVPPALLVPAWLETGEGRTRIAHHCCTPINDKKLSVSRLHILAQRCDFMEVTADGCAGSGAAAASTLRSSSPGGEVGLPKPGQHPRNGNGHVPAGHACPFCPLLGCRTGSAEQRRALNKRLCLRPYDLCGNSTCSSSFFKAFPALMVAFGCPSR